MQRDPVGNRAFAVAAKGTVVRAVTKCWAAQFRKLYQ